MGRAMNSENVRLLTSVILQQVKSLVWLVLRVLYIYFDHCTLMWTDIYLSHRIPMFFMPPHLYKTMLGASAKKFVRLVNWMNAWNQGSLSHHHQKLPRKTLHDENRNIKRMLEVEQKAAANETYVSRIRFPLLDSKYIIKGIYIIAHVRKRVPECMSTGKWSQITHFCYI